MENNCKGLKFRGASRTYISNTTIGVKKTLTLLKRSSCNNCDECKKNLEYLTNFLELPIGKDIVGNIEDKKIYELKINHILNEGKNNISFVEFIEK